MNKVIETLIFALVILSLLSYSQSVDFEGEITFKRSFDANIDPETAFSLKERYGDSSKVFIKGNNYKQIYINSNWIKEAVYIGKENRYYFVFHGIDTLYSVDCGYPDDNFTLNEDLSSIKKILGYNCIKFEMLGVKSKKTYYYAPDIKLANADFSNHKLGGYNLYIQNAQSVYLYLKTENQYGIEEIEAVDIERKELPSSFFDPPSLPRK